VAKIKQHCRSYARIEHWGDLGLHMVNADAYSYFIYVDPLIAMYDHPNEYVQVKIKDRDSDKSKSMYPGEIIGKMSISKIENIDEAGAYSKIVLYIGSADKLLDCNKKTQLIKGQIEEHRYIFPHKEFKCFLETIKAMDDQQSKFKKLKRGTRVICKKSNIQKL